MLVAVQQWHGVVAERIMMSSNTTMTAKNVFQGMCLRSLVFLSYAVLLLAQIRLKTGDSPVILV
jgi:hypothetical protein